MARRPLAVLGILALLVTLQAVRAEERALLREQLAVGDLWHIQLDMQLAGKLLMKSGEKTIRLDLKASAGHDFPERVLGLDKEGLPDRLARFYDRANAEIIVHESKQSRGVRSDRRLQIAQRMKDGTVTYSPSGPLTREELDLTGDHLDVLAIHGLLPGKEVAVGEKWELPVTSAQGLLSVDGITAQILVCRLEEIKDGLACISITGTAEGLVSGAEVKSVIEGFLYFDVSTKRWTGMRWGQKDERSQGPASPGSRTETNTTVVRSFDVKAEQLSDAIASSLPAEPSAGHLLLQYRDPKGRHEFIYERGWHTVTQNDQCTVLRLLERGELLGQVNITPQTRARPGEHTSPDEFQRQVHDIPSFKLDQVLQIGEVPTEPGYWIYRVSAVGQANDLSVLQNHYLVAGPKGDQLVLAFTTEVSLADRLGGKDLSIVGTVTFPGK